MNTEKAVKILRKSFNKYTILTFEEMLVKLRIVEDTPNRTGHAASANMALHKLLKEGFIEIRPIGCGEDRSTGTQWQLCKGSKETEQL